MKLPFYILEAEAYSEQIFSSHDECIEKYGPAIEEASRQLNKKRMKAGRFLIFRHQVIALPASHFDQRLLELPICLGQISDLTVPRQSSSRTRSRHALVRNRPR